VKPATQMNGNHCNDRFPHATARQRQVHAGGGINAERGITVGKPRMSERFAQAMIALAALVCIANAIFMIVAPIRWYWAVPTVPATGPANSHFITDVGLAYLCCGITLCYGAIYPSGRWLALIAGAMWLTAHGLFHVFEFATGEVTGTRFLQDLPGVLGPALLVVVAFAILVATQRIVPAGLPQRTFLLLAHRLAPSESQFLEELAIAPGHALEKFIHFMPAATHRYQAEPAVFHLARLGATLAEDCGPCALTAARGALTDGVSRDLINTALGGGHGLYGDHQVAFEFGRSIANQAPDAFALGDATEQSLGRTVRLELAMTASLVRAYPALKRGLRLSKACSATKLSL